MQAKLHQCGLQARRVVTPHCGIGAFLQVFWPSCRNDWMQLV
ncbi:hypothetical protein [Methanobrevibacter sp.]